MKRAWMLMAGVGLSIVSAIGCHHTAGACDCIHPHPKVVHHGPQSHLGHYAEEHGTVIVPHQGPVVVPEQVPERIETPPKQMTRAK